MLSLESEGWCGFDCAHSPRLCLQTAESHDRHDNVYPTSDERRCNACQIAAADRTHASAFPRATRPGPRRSSVERSTGPAIQPAPFARSRVWQTRPQKSPRGAQHLTYRPRGDHGPLSAMIVVTKMIIVLDALSDVSGKAK
ncbi:uncharacterized protein PSANT_06622 [Moesziomyces antarcticus]|uniref:Uncharacterized protein n=1 Tax=Pseudozyma antarctica TaxID=84753 RepID=A0A5C3FYU5_PSEA2|nr:uncharacterized protein PSANT_06622 [Moesziomyces antarcticus]